MEAVWSLIESAPEEPRVTTFIAVVDRDEDATVPPLPPRNVCCLDASDNATLMQSFVLRIGHVASINGRFNLIHHIPLWYDEQLDVAEAHPGDNFYIVFEHCPDPKSLLATLAIFGVCPCDLPANVVFLILSTTSHSEPGVSSLDMTSRNEECVPEDTRFKTFAWLENRHAELRCLGDLPNVALTLETALSALSRVRHLTYGKTAKDTVAILGPLTRCYTLWQEGEVHGTVATDIAINLLVPLCRAWHNLGLDGWMKAASRQWSAETNACRHLLSLVRVWYRITELESRVDGNTFRQSRGDFVRVLQCAQRAQQELEQEANLSVAFCCYLRIELHSSAARVCKYLNIKDDRLGHLRAGLELLAHEGSDLALRECFWTKARFLSHLAETQPADIRQQVIEELYAHVRVIGNADGVSMCLALDEDAEFNNSIGQIQRMSELASASLELKRQYLGPRSVEVARSLHVLANACGALGSLNEQRQHLNEALDIKKHQFGEDHIETVIVKVSIANSLSARGDFVTMRTTLEDDLLPRLIDFYGPSHVQVARAYDSLANAKGSLGDAPGMKKMAEASLEIKSRLLGPRHIQTMNTKHILASCHGLLGDWAIQQKILENEVLPVYRETYGKDHIQVASALQDLGLAYGSQGQHQKKRDLILEALEINRAHYKDPQHFQMSNILHNLANAYGDCDDLDKKKELLEQSLEIKIRHYGREHPQTANTLQNLGNAYGALGDLDKMQESLQESERIMVQHFGESHIQTATVRHNLAHCLGAKGKYTDMYATLMEIVPVFEGYYKKGNVLLSHVYHGIGLALHSRMRQLYNDTVETKKDTLGDDQTQAILDQIREMSNECNRFIIDAFAIRRACWGTDHEQTKSSARLLAKAEARFKLIQAQLLGQILLHITKKHQQQNDEEDDEEQVQRSVKRMRLNDDN